MKINEIQDAIFNYPKGFYDFTDGVPIEDYVIKKWLVDGLKQVRKRIVDNDLDESHFAISSGNTKVFGELYRQKNGKYTISLSVTKSYSDNTFIDVEL